MSLTTPRLVLRPAQREDAPAVCRLLQDQEIQMNTLYIPYPYTLDHAHSFIHSCQIADENDCNYALVRQADGEFLGMISLVINPDHKRGMVGYWLGKAYWNQGYMSEALQRVMQYGFKERGLQKVYAECFVENRGSARVMEKSGMVREGLLREYFYHRIRDAMMDVYHYGIIRAEYEAKGQ